MHCQILRDGIWGFRAEGIWNPDQLSQSPPRALGDANILFSKCIRWAYHVSSSLKYYCVRYVFFYRLLLTFCSVLDVGLDHDNTTRKSNNTTKWKPGMSFLFLSNINVSFFSPVSLLSHSRTHQPRQANWGNYFPLSTSNRGWITALFLKKRSFICQQGVCSLINKMEISLWTRCIFSCEQTRGSFVNKMYASLSTNWMFLSNKLRVHCQQDGS